MNNTCTLHTDEKKWVKFSLLTMTVPLLNEHADTKYFLKHWNCHFLVGDFTNIQYISEWIQF